ncbi:hypothetical protein TB2_032411 [Malus domestica]
MLLGRTVKSSIFSTVSFASIFFVIYADSIISNLSMQRVGLSNHEILDHDHQTQIPEEQIKSTSQLPNMQANIDNIEDEIHDPLIPPENATQDEG